MSAAGVRYFIEREGQPYVDERVEAEPIPLAAAVASAFGRHIPARLLGFNRVPLRWITRNERGRAVPKEKTK